MTFVCLFDVGKYLNFFVEKERGHIKNKKKMAEITKIESLNGTNYQRLKCNMKGMWIMGFCPGHRGNSRK